jgi:predicted lipid-binding transport protein (Tim44 family)
VRGPEVRALRIVALDANKSPAQMTVEVDVRGSRYIEDRDTTEVVSGSQHSPTLFHEQWRLALDGDDAHPWRIVATNGSPVG